MSHCTPEATLKPVYFQFMPKLLYIMSSPHKCAERLFQICGPASAKLLSPNLLCVRGTAHDLSVDIAEVLELCTPLIFKSKNVVYLNFCCILLKLSKCVRVYECDSNATPCNV